MADSEWRSVTADFPTWKDTGHVEAKMTDGSLVRGWITGHDTDDNYAVFEFEIDGDGFGDLSAITEFRVIE